jgi:hypothetical protein
MRRLFFTILFATFLIAPAFAAEAPVKQDSTEALKPNKMTISDCLSVARGLQALDEPYTAVVAAGKPSESVTALHYKLSSKVRDIQGHNLFLLQQIQLEAQDANRKAQLDIMSRRTSSEDPSAPVKAGTLEAITFDQRMADYVKLPCTLQLEHINAADLDPDLPGTTLNLLWKIRDK